MSLDKPEHEHVSASKSELVVQSKLLPLGMKEFLLLSIEPVTENCRANSPSKTLLYPSAQKLQEHECYRGKPSERKQAGRTLLLDMLGIAGE
jgi:hypothetical protein